MLGVRPRQGPDTWPALITWATILGRQPQGQGGNIGVFVAGVDLMNRAFICLFAAIAALAAGVVDAQAGLLHQRTLTIDRSVNIFGSTLFDLHLELVTFYLYGPGRLVRRG